MARSKLLRNDPLEQAEEYELEPPRPLRRKPEPADPYPVDALDEVRELGDAARAIQAVIQCPTAITAQSVLAAATLAVQGHADVVLPTGQRRPISNFFITVAESGERKTSADQEALRPLRRYESELHRAHDDLKHDHDMEEKLWNHERDRIAKGARGMTEKRAALAALGPPPVPPLLPMLTPQEPTVEGLFRLLAEGHPSLGVFSSEGGRFLGGHGMGKDHRVKTATTLSTLWDGEPVHRARGGEGAVTLAGRRVAMHLMCQPTIADLVLGNSVLAEQGLLSRLLVTAPDSTIGLRMWRDPPDGAREAIGAYEDWLFEVLQVPPPLAEGQRNELDPRPLKLMPKAQRYWKNYADEIESRMATGGDLEAVRGLANKAAEHAARLAAVLALAEDIEIRGMQKRHLECGAELVDHYLAEAVRLHSTAGIDQDILLAEALLSWLQRNWKRPMITLQDVYQRAKPKAIRDAKKARHLVSILADHGWLLPVEGGAKIGGVHRREVFRIRKD